jgi:hypothetical protein
LCRLIVTATRRGTSRRGGQDATSGGASGVFDMNISKS